MLPLYQAERQVSWLRDLQSPPPSQAVAQWRLKTDFSPVTVTRSHGICTRFPFTLCPCAGHNAKAPFAFHSIATVL